MGIGMIVLVVLLLAMMGVVPAWPHSRQWGYYPSGGVGLVLVLVLFLPKLFATESINDEAGLVVVCVLLIWLRLAVEFGFRILVGAAVATVRCD